MFVYDWQTKEGFTTSPNKVKIYYDQIAYLQTIQLVKAHPVEIGWNMVINPYKDGYMVCDILVYPQKVSSAYISVDTARWGLWKNTLDYKTERALNGNGHSHVNMQVFASAVDLKQQHDEVLTKGKGFYLFQIWNKRNEISSYFYDIDNKIYYPDGKVEIIIEGVDKFVKDSFKMLIKEGETIESKQVI